MRKIVEILNAWKFDIIVLSIFSFTFFFLITEYKILDIKDHNLLLSEYLKMGHFPVPPGYYILIYTVDLLIRIKYPFVAAAAIVLTFFSWLKYKIILGWIATYLNATEGYGLFITLTLLFFSPIYVPWIDGEFWYLGKFTSTTWHNSTLIAVFPFCLLLVIATLRWFEHDLAKTTALIFLYSIAILMIKPSFLLCFIPAFPIYALVSEKGLTAKAIRAAAISATLFGMILVEKFLIFQWDPMIDHLYSPQERSQVVLAPMKVWLYFSDQPVFDFLSSFPLLIAFILLWRKEAFKSSFFSFSLILLFFSLLVYGLFSETGFRQFHGNFYWQIPIALLLNSLSILLHVGKECNLDRTNYRFRHRFIFSIFVLQGLLGVIYWLRIFFGSTLS